MRREGNRVGGFGKRSLRHHSRTSRKRPRGVAPSPSRLSARMPERPRTTGTTFWPARRRPSVRRPGRVRTRIRGKVNLRMAVTSDSQISYKWHLLLALLALNALLRVTATGMQREAAGEAG